MTMALPSKRSLLHTLEIKQERICFLERRLERFETNERMRKQAWQEVSGLMLRGKPPLPARLAPNRATVKSMMLAIAEAEDSYWCKSTLSVLIGVAVEEIEAATLELWCEGLLNNPPR